MAKVNLDLNSLKPNSHKYKEQQRQALEKGDEKKEVLNGEVVDLPKRTGVVSTKKSLWDKFKDAFISDDIKDVKTYIIWDVGIPTIKNTILGSIEMIFFDGDSRSRRGYGREPVSYNSYYKSEYNGNRRSVRRREREDDRGRRYEASNEKVDYRNIVLRDRRDAEEVVDYLQNHIKECDQVSIADFIDHLGEMFSDFKATSNYVDNNWGWVDERDIGIRRVSNGYLIDVEEAHYLD